jgi:hypothetical protein
MIPVFTFDNFAGDAAAIRERVIACGFGTETRAGWRALYGDLSISGAALVRSDRGDLSAGLSCRGSPASA